MTKFRLLPYLFFFILISCSGGLEENVITSYPNGNPQRVEYYQKGDAEKHKIKEIRFNSNGEKEFEGYFSNNEKSGVWTEWYLSGEKKSEYSYKKGMKNGSFTEWYENGEIKFQGTYTNNTPSGKWQFWNEDGELESEQNY